MWMGIIEFRHVKRFIINFLAQSRDAGDGDGTARQDSKKLNPGDNQGR